MNSYDYIVVGAGPAALQMGYFLQQAGRRYVILEAKDCAGSFFTQFPRHRTLISLNKCYNWFDEADFNLRYDWNSLLTSDNSLRFPDYSKALFPHADTLVKYLQDFAAKFELNIQYNTPVTAVTRETAGERNFVLGTGTGEIYRGKCLLMATGAVKPNIPSDIEGIELAEGYEVHEIDPERFTNKRVVIIGHGNSGFEIANHLSGHAATIQIYTGGRLIKHAWQTHFVGDLRAINNTFVEMNQLKMPHLISGARITKLFRNPDGTITVHYTEDVPHWAVPGTIRGVGVYDHVVRATGWKYIERSLFASDIVPAADAKGKFPIVGPNWESTVPDLFIIGAAMANNDRKATAGFIHGFRYNIRTLFHLLEERYHGVPLPVRTMPVNSEEGLRNLVQSLLTRISTTSGLFQMFGVLAEVLVIADGQVQWFPELPMKYALQQPEMMQGKDVIAITLELGFDSFPKDTDALTFIHPADPGGEGRCVAFIHPVFRHYSDGVLRDEMHMQASVFTRYDAFDADFAAWFDKEKPHNLIYNFINRVVKVSANVLPTNTFIPDGEIGQFTPWTPEQRYEVAELPKCSHTRQQDSKFEPAKYQ